MTAPMHATCDTETVSRSTPSSRFPPSYYLLLSANLAFQLINIICWHITRSPIRRGARLRLRNTLTSVTGIFAFYLHTFYDTCTECYRRAIIVRMRDSHLVLASSSFTLSIGMRSELVVVGCLTSSIEVGIGGGQL